MPPTTQNKIKKEELLKIKSQLTDDGILLTVKNKEYRIQYPKDVWQSYSETNRELLLDNLTFMQTCHLAEGNNKKGIVYDTALPFFETFAFKGTMYDLPSTAVIDSKKTSEYLKGFFNMRTIFSSYDTVLPDVDKRKKASSKKKQTAIILFTAGKESLLTLAMCLEMGITPIPIYIIEDKDHPEAAHKEEIIKTLKQEYGIEVHKILSEPGKLRYCDLGEPDNNLGAGTQFLTYTLEVLPFAEYYNADYILFGNEYSCDDAIYDDEGFKANFCFDQCSEWTKQLNAIAGIMTGGRVQIGSIVANLYELGLLKILHQRYPVLAKLQMSCFSDSEEGKNHLWCGNCSKCARLFVFFKSLGMDVTKIGFKIDMFQPESKKHYAIFEGEGRYSYDVSGLGTEEQALAFYLSIEKGEKGPLVDEFKSSPLFASVKSNFKKINDKYFGIHESIAIPYALKEKAFDIFDETFQGDFTPKDFRLKQIVDAEKEAEKTSQEIVDETEQAI